LKPENSTDHAFRTVLIAGAGYVSRPVGDILVRHGVKVIYGCRTLKTAQQLAEQVGAGASAIALDVNKKDQLDEAIKGVDLIVRWLDFASTIHPWANSFVASCHHPIVRQIHNCIA
jgi:saccharopine dehydrogenase-like NADP-dependent oxidoreductase